MGQLQPALGQLQRASQQQWAGLVVQCLRESLSCAPLILPPCCPCVLLWCRRVVESDGRHAHADAVQRAQLHHLAHKITTQGQRYTQNFWVRFRTNILQAASSPNCFVCPFNSVVRLLVPTAHSSSARLAFSRRRRTEHSCIACILPQLHLPLSCRADQLARLTAFILIFHDQSFSLAHPQDMRMRILNESSVLELVACILIGATCTGHESSWPYH